MRKIVIGNWKMQLGVVESVEIASKIARALASTPPSVTIALCPTHAALFPVAAAKLSFKSSFLIGSQDLSTEQKGAFTGEVSGRELKEMGVQLVLVGHSERRHSLGETPAVVAKKLQAAFFAKLTPVLCVGESLSDRTGGRWKNTLQEQLLTAFGSLNATSPRDLYVAYEPVWAIGTGKSCSLGDAEEAIRFIRAVVARSFGERWVRQKLSLLYGGSVDTKNAQEFFSSAEIDGVLVGGASLQAKSFIQIVSQAARSTV